TIAATSTPGVAARASKCTRRAIRPQPITPILTGGTNSCPRTSPLGDAVVDRSDRPTEQRPDRGAVEEAEQRPRPRDRVAREIVVQQREVLPHVLAATHEQPGGRHEERAATHPAEHHGNQAGATPDDRSTTQLPLPGFDLRRRHADSPSRRSSPGTDSIRARGGLCAQ